MNVLVDELVERVKANMEELVDDSSSPVALTAGVDVETYIRAKLPDALLAVWSSVPLSILPSVDCLSSLSISTCSDGGGMIVLPDDMWHLVEFRMAGWTRSVTRFFEIPSLEYELQNNPYTQGGCSSPVCFLTTREGSKTLIFYPLSTTVSPRVLSAVYIPYPKPETGSVEIPNELIPKVCYTCASMVYDILGQPDMAAAMLRGIV